MPPGAGGRAVRQAARRLAAPGPAASPEPGACSSQEGRGAGRAHAQEARTERLWDKREPSPPRKSGGSCLSPLTHFCTSEPSTEPGTVQEPSER